MASPNTFALHNMQASSSRHSVAPGMPAMSSKDVESQPIVNVEADDEIEDQSTRLPPKKFALVCFSMVMAVFMTSLEQTSVSTTLPAMARTLGDGKDISWVGTSFLIGNAAGQAVWGRMSDIFGRKNMLIGALSFFLVGNLICGFAQNISQMLAFRTLAGIGGGGIMILCLVIMSDLASLKNRGKIQGIVGVGVALGTGVGPILGGAFAGSNWRWIFWIICPPTFITLIQVIVWLPLKPVTGDWKKKIKKIDFIGIGLLISATVLFLVPISGGGTTFSWSSPAFISLMLAAIVVLVVFLLHEHYYATLPLVPLRIFRSGSLSLLEIITFATGLFNFAVLYFIPVYLQIVKGYSALLASAILQATILPQVFMAVASGFIMSKTGKYLPVIWGGYIAYTISAGLVTMLGRDTSRGAVVVFLIIGGIGTGATLQTTLVAMQANAPHADRAVVTGVRNLSRFIGSAVGISACTSLVNNALPKDSGGSGFELPTDITPDQKNALLDMYSSGFRRVWIFNLAVSLFILVCMLGVRETQLRDDDAAAGPAGGPSAGGPASNGSDDQGADEKDDEKERPRDIDNEERINRLVLSISRREAERDAQLQAERARKDNMI